MTNKLGVYKHFGFFKTYEEAYESVKVEYRYQKTLRDSNVRVYRCRSHRGNKCNATVKIVILPDGRFEVGKRFEHSHSLAIFENIWERHQRKWCPPTGNYNEGRERSAESVKSQDVQKKEEVGRQEVEEVVQPPEKTDKSKEYTMKRPRGPRGPYKKKNKIPPAPSEELSRSEHSINMLLRCLQDDLTSVPSTSESHEEEDMEEERPESRRKLRSHKELCSQDGSSSSTLNSKMAFDCEDLEEQNNALMAENSDLYLEVIKLKEQLKRKCAENDQLISENVLLKMQLKQR